VSLIQALAPTPTPTPAPIPTPTPTPSPTATLYVSQVGVSMSVAEYAATTGAAINANFITGLNNPYGLAVAPATPTPTPSPTHAVAKDFNGDRYADLVWENTATGGRSIWLLKNGVYSSTISLPTVSRASESRGSSSQRRLERWLAQNPSNA